MPTPAKAGWALEEYSAFFRAFQEHGAAFDKVSEAMGGSMSAEDCEALYHQHQTYLSLAPNLQSEVAFLAMAKDAAKHQAEPPASNAKSGGGTGAGSSGVKEEGEEAEGEAPGEDGTTTSDGGEGMLAASRARRTPKRGALATPSGKGAGSRTPLSTGKRQRAGARVDDIYEYYDEGEEVTASARKRRASKRLEFQPSGVPGGAQPTRRRERADEKGGIDALLALAEAGAEGQATTEDEGLEGREDLEAELPPPPPRRQRRTPHSTPAKGGGRSRPGSAHNTPGRGGRRLSGASPGGVLASPWGGLGIGDGADLGLGELPLADFGYLTSPAFGLAPGVVPSPQNPMPRLRNRKQAPEKTPGGLSPIRGLFGRRTSLGSGPSALLGGIGSLGAYGAEEAGPAAGGPPLSPLEACLRHCLTSRGRRWAFFEFFYSAVDRPFFMQTTMDDLLKHCGLAGVDRLTRKEWNLLRSGLGRPRRLSAAFLREERCRLEQWRQRCRMYYSVGGTAGAPAGAATADGAAGSSAAAIVAGGGDGADLPRGVGVGQRVTARHPITRQLHDGSVLTAGPSCYRVQFDRRELGVELVPDVEVMPVDAGDCLPPALLAARPCLVVNGRLYVDGKQVPPVPRSLPPAIPAASTAAASGGTGGVAGGAALAAAPPAGMGVLATLPAGITLKQEQQPALAAGTAAVQAAAQSRLASIAPQALSELAVVLDKKEALLVQLRAMNDEAQAGVHTDTAGGDSGPFKGAYAQVVLQLRDVNAEVERKLLELEKDPGTEGGAADGLGGPAVAVGPASLEAALAQTPLTADSLANVALGEAAGVMAACRQKLAEVARAEQQQQQQQGEQAMEVEGPAATAVEPASGTEGPSPSGRDVGGGSSAQPPAAAAPPLPLDWGGADVQALASLIQGCVWSMVLLQRGSDQGVPLATLVTALDTSLAHAKPRAEANQGLYAEVQTAMRALKEQLLATS